ncbi:nucleoside deaminase [Desulfovibrio sp. JC022]|uniref:nucleoside deaminase n=1 Tax=Desulfovibrio sp. JC022 TaxID=2593642 RepID=UPI0013D4AC16|nr:nucleoside deaminase [Desulfovibrio sp. JC022]NDV22943.1 nucleoside deaminase [Desulfovibrio sp. JC022]
MSEMDNKFMEEAYRLAKKSFDEGGLPIGSVLVRDGEIIGGGHNQRVQKGDPIAHGEMDCIRNAGRQKTYKDTTIYTTLSPCMMCSGTIVQFGISRVVIGENRNFGGNEEFLKSRGVQVDILDHPKCIELMERLKAEKPALWAEDIGED